MQLLSLQLNGFKSFADKTIIKFKDGITGIVGPNGSGKSNLIEAIRWVLGEQSAKTLRGDKMADVIFNGSADRKPLNRAAVTITFDNSDHYLQSEYNTITVTRRLYRNGESEYLLNNQEVRLRDIVNLFIDSGLGRESFSIISQGRIAAIFNGKPADRRAIIETVAGVAKYKKNKETAGKRLQATTDNLNRVNDIVNELTGQLGPLKEQSALAQDYLEQKKQFDLFDRTRLVRLVDSQQEKMTTVNQQVTAAKKQRTSYDQQIKVADQKLAELETAQRQHRQVKDQLQQKILEQTSLIAKLNNQQSLSSARQQQRQEELQRLNKELKAKKGVLAQLSAKLKQQENQLTCQQTKIKQHRHELKVARSQSLAERERTLKRQIENLRNQQVDLMQQQTTVHNELLFIQRNHQQESQHRRQNETQLQAAKQRLALLQHQQADHQAVVDRLAQQLDQLQKKLADSRNHAGQLDRQYDQEQRQWYQLLGDVHSMESRIKSYRAMAADYTGFYQGVKHVLEHRQDFPGLKGAVSELIDVPDQLTTAIETALGSQLQQLVVDSQETGKQVIRFLVQQRAGRATILPLNALRPARQLNLNSLTSLPGFVGVASRLINFDSDIQLAIDHLLSATVIADNLDHATIIANRAHHRARVVTLDGQVINASGSMSGGANRRQRIGLLSQKQQLKSMKTQLANVQKHASDAEQRVQHLAAARSANHDLLIKFQQQNQTVSDQLGKAQSDLQLASAQLAATKRQLDVFQVQRGAGSDQDYHQQIAEKQRQAQEVAEQLKRVKDELSQKQAQLDDLTASAAAQADQLHQMEQQLAVAEERLNHDQRDAHETKQRCLQVEDEVLSLTKQRESLQKNDHRDNGQRKSTAQVLAETKKSLVDKQQQADQNEEKLTSLDQELADHNAASQRLRDLQRATLDQLNQLTGKQARLETSIDNSLNRLSEDYAMTLDEARQHLSTLDDDTISTRLKLLKKGLDELGQVNLGAIDQYREMKERFDFLSSQRQDLLNAKKQLLETMNQMDNQVKSRFITTFKEVSTAFTETFSDIFEGGRAKLQLTDPDDLLNTGVDIMAQPPGKRNQQLSLLSGGEQALTAIALLFAILKVRPVPFAILDEPEAALDAVNVDRFAHYLGRFGNHGPQFIVITHRKGTMMNANVLYGVTMQESGVSRMVSVDVADALSAAEKDQQQ
ncbi:MAG: chromosome segregation protein SMC [[Lactobacillus] timonensis]|jgi:chromosome segregation protein|uniref:chromosome segregation protein SMC n=1 Tax=[Lactobacillus] timonensis TaxID=1970790 RepID=UPI002356C641|nr:chromosome segregation protein SMC [[Lactobacillus] timonensis]MCI1925997.1 chromosome segregation protein SMC [[Lactobacillus] timonensis]MCI1957393.1 chromosome segregation protein SMC [[Lactobacillus] timonensis]MCI1970491.1 chromosome segregation protein SMC [[Lactobacillus] timonensis]MCI2006551.1 chromosome segregation protein SMC [[Lactobacillus] timonensis]